MRLTVALGMALLSALAVVGSATAQGRDAAPQAEAVLKGRITKVEVDKGEAAPGALLKILAEFRITEGLEWAEVSGLARDVNRVDHREGGPRGQEKGVRFVLYQDGKRIASQELRGPYTQGKALTHTFEAKAPEKPGRSCFELVAVHTLNPEGRLDSRQACLTIPEATGYAPQVTGLGEVVGLHPAQIAQKAESHGIDASDVPPPSADARPTPAPAVTPGERPSPIGPEESLRLPDVLDPSQMTRQQFEGLPPDTRLRVGDRILTKGDLPKLADEELKKAEAWHRAQEAKINSELAAEQAKLDQQRKVELASAAAEIMSKLKTGPNLAQIQGKLMDVPCLTRPQITGFLIGSKLTPGGTIVMFGCGFTGNPTMRLYGEFSGEFVTLTPELWEPDVFAGVVPAGLEAIPHRGFLQVHTDHGASDPWPVDFLPVEEIRVLSPVQSSCSDAAFTKDLCAKTPCGGSSCGSHTNYGFWPDAGNDRVEAKGHLWYGWTYYGVELSQSANNGDATATFNGDPSWPRITVTWGVEPFGSIAYNVKIWIRGPKGMPHYQPGFKGPQSPLPGQKIEAPNP